MHIYDNDGKRVCKNCVSELRHKELISVLSDINQTLQRLQRLFCDNLENTSMVSIGEKLDSIRYILKNR